jgi:hypothetical protein
MVLLCIVTSKHGRNATSRYEEIKVLMMVTGCIGQQGEVINLAYRREWQHYSRDKLASVLHVDYTSDQTISWKLTTSFPDHREVEIATVTCSFSMPIVIIRSRFSRDDNRGARDRC